AYARSWEICQQLGDPPELFLALFGIWTVHYLRANTRSARILAEQLLRRAEVSRQPAVLLRARTSLGISCMIAGELLPAKDHFEIGYSFIIDLRQCQEFRFGGQDARIVCLAHTGA